MSTIYAAALNFRDEYDALEPMMRAAPYVRPPVAPVLAIKPANCRIENGEPIPCPRDAMKLRAGGTLALVIGQRARRVREQDVLEYLSGYTLAIDISIPESSYYRPTVKQRCRDGFCPVGPYIVAVSALPYPEAIEIRISVNGNLACVASTSTLIRSVPRLLADVTEFMTLNPGDLLLIGEPFHSPLVGPGDRVRVEVAGIGALENPVVAEVAR
jgi:5-oxopent-3-ene-1,2,5-tricarboxylate decarboxylase/2-hydroxyhepta-2,4-diene-1,7-dioate isomerase